MLDRACIDCGQTTCAMEEKKTAAQLDPALIPELERMWNRNPGSVTMEQIAGSLRKAGVDHVLSSECAARCAAAKAEALLEERLGAGEPLILSNDPDVWKFLWENYRQLAPRFAFYPPELELFGERARTVLGAELVLAFVSVGSAAAEAKESSDVDAVVDARGLYRILVCSDAAPSAECTAVVERFPMPAVSGKYGRLLEPLAKNDDADFEPVTVTADSRELRCALCHNLGQARRAIEAGEFDVIRVIS